MKAVRHYTVVKDDVPVAVYGYLSQAQSSAAYNRPATVIDYLGRVVFSA